MRTSRGESMTIDKLKWHDAKKSKPKAEECVLLWLRTPRPFSTEMWTVGFWADGSWYIKEECKACDANCISHWAQLSGPGGGLTSLANAMEIENEDS